MSQLAELSPTSGTALDRATSIFFVLPLLISPASARRTNVHPRDSVLSQFEKSVVINYQVAAISEGSLVVTCRKIIPMCTEGVISSFKAYYNYLVSVLQTTFSSDILSVNTATDYGHEQYFLLRSLAIHLIKTIICI